jgi:hypothetical protein
VCLPFPVAMRSIKIGRLCTGLPGQKSKTMFQKYAVKKVLDIWLKWQSTCWTSANPWIEAPVLPTPPPTRKTTLQRHIELSLFLICTMKQFIKRVSSTDCLLPKKVKESKAYRSIKCFLNFWVMWHLCSVSCILAVFNLQWCFFPFFSQRYFII